MITLLPLIFEVKENLIISSLFYSFHQVKRESMVEEFERVQIGIGLQEGKTPQELAMSGLHGAIEPKVLNK
jgi:hypothetical protein